MRALLFLLIASTASAGPRVEIGMSLGGHAFSHSTELGVADDPSQPGPMSAGFVGFRAAYPIIKRLAAEAEINVIPTKDDVLGDRITVYGLATHARFDFLVGRFKPFVVAGLGAHVLFTSSPQMSNDIDQAWHWGVGARYTIADSFDLRADWRHLIVPGRTRDGATSEFELSLGVAYVFGKKHAAPPPPRPVPPAPPPTIDSDRDKILDADERLNAELAGIGFELDSARLDVYSAPILERAYQILVANPDWSIEIAGHTSSEGDADRNLELSLHRAEAVRTWLVRRGVDAKRILTVGHGSQEPIGDNRTEDGRRKNRRIEFRILTSVE